MAWLSCSSTGTPRARTRVAAVIHWALTQGPLAPGGRAQPATVYGFGWVVIGWPPTLTRGFDTIGCACPVCMHSTVAPP